MASFTTGCLSDEKNTNVTDEIILIDKQTENIEIQTNVQENIEQSVNEEKETPLASTTDISDNGENNRGNQAPAPEPKMNLTEKLRIGSFNIQVFGVSKADKPEVMEVLADITRTYDIIAIQEIRDKSQTALPELVDLVNSDGSNYEYVVSERLGRTSSKEQYAYVFNTDTILITSEALSYPEPEGTDPFHRQPYIASFRAVNGNYDAVLIVIHTDPDEATEEINALDDVLEYSQSIYPDEQDFIIMGDLNADGSYFDEDSTSDLDEYYWLIDDSEDTTTKSTDYTYDRIILTDDSDFTGEFGVFRYDLEYNLTYDETVAVSDHYPVYAEFIAVNDRD
ncbi:endonuclease/exonuclease/phosphatase family protein [Methanolobus sp. ZRKC4]|uniref:exonuclease/endonuclease/phosphatase family protein n=1 Tax=Methanolobus sp. ZRKC4 TaxID=3125787 RepID=UPI00324A760F